MRRKYHSTLHIYTHTKGYRFVFFFSSRRRHTRSKRDWSSDVCLPISRTRPRGIETRSPGLPSRRKLPPVTAAVRQAPWAPSPCSSARRAMSAATGGRPDDLPRFISAVIVGDPSACENDSRPQQQGQDRDDPRGRASDDRKVPKRGVSSERNLVAQRDGDRSEEERHLQLKDRALERSCRLAGDHDDAGGEKYRQCPPDNGPEALGNARERLIAPENSNQPQVDHEDRRHYGRDRQDMDRLHRRNNPPGALDRLAQRRLLEPCAKIMERLRSHRIYSCSAKTLFAKSLHHRRTHAILQACPAMGPANRARIADDTRCTHRRRLLPR